MKLGKLSLGIAAVALAAAPTFAQAVFVPTVAPLNGEESELSSTATIVVGLLAVGAVVIAVVAAGGGSDDPVSF